MTNRVSLLNTTIPWKLTALDFDSSVCCSFDVM